MLLEEIDARRMLGNFDFLLVNRNNEHPYRQDGLAWEAAKASRRLPIGAQSRRGSAGQRLS